MPYFENGAKEKLKEAGSENVPLESMPVPKAYLNKALSVVLGMAASGVYNLVDTYFTVKTKNLDRFVSCGDGRIVVIL